MKIELTTSGGLAGRGVGSVTIDGVTAIVDGRLKTELTRDEQSRLLRLPRCKGRRGRRPSTAADAISYKLSIDGEDWTWTDVDAPDDCAAWADALFAIRERVVAQPSSSM